MNKKYIIALLFLVALLVFKQSSRFDQVDYGIYFAQVESVVESQNLNVFDNLKEARIRNNEPLIVTPTHYDPDFHPWGGSLFFIPPYLLGKVGFIDRTNQEESSSIKKVTSHTLMSLFNLVYMCVGLAIIWIVLKKEKIRENVRFFSLFIFLFATPLYCYSVVVPGNMNIVPFLLMSFLLYWIKEKKGKFNNIDFFFFSLYITCGVLVKSEFILYFLCPIVWILKEKDFKKLLYLIAGALPGIILFFVSRYIQYGEFLVSYGGINIKNFLLSDLLFNENYGYLFVSPFFLILYSLFLVFRKHLTLKIFLLIPILKLFLESFTFSSGVDFGARNYIVDLPVILINFSLILEKINTNKRKALYLISTFCGIWTISCLSMYLFVKANPYSYLIPFDIIKTNLLYLFSSVMPNTFSFYKIASFLLLTGAVYLIIKYINKVNYYKTTIAFFSGLMIISLLNFINREKITYSTNVYVGKNERGWFYNENIGSMNERVDFLRLKRKFKEAEKIKNKINEYKKNTF